MFSLSIHLCLSVHVYILASFLGLHAAFGCTKEQRGPSMFPHVRDVKSRLVVERTWASRGSEQQEEQWYEVHCNLPHISTYVATGDDYFVHQVLNV